VSCPAVAKEISFNALTVIQSRDSERVTHTKAADLVSAFQCLDGHSVPGHVLVEPTLGSKEFQCLDGHSVPGHAAGWVFIFSAMVDLAFQCLDGHSVPGRASSRGKNPSNVCFNALTVIQSRDTFLKLETDPQHDALFQCLDGHSVPGLRTEYSADPIEVALSSSTDDENDAPKGLSERLQRAVAPRNSLNP
jgi:hypothetical protein